MNLLLLSVTFPYPPTSGGTQTRTYHLLKHLAQQHRITLLTQAPPVGGASRNENRTPSQLSQDLAALQSLLTPNGGGIQIFDRPHQSTAPPNLLTKLNHLRQSLTGTPANIRHWHNPALQLWLDQAIATNPTNPHPYDAITCEHSVNASFIRPHWTIPTLLNVHSSAYHTSQSQLRLGTAEQPWRDRLLLPALRRYETSLYRQFSQIIVTTDDDAQSVRSLVPNAPIAIIPNGVDLSEFTPRTQEPPNRQLIFTGGMDYNVNIDTARHLALDILPHLQADYPDIRLTLVGSKPDPTVQELASPTITVTGRVPSLATHLHDSLLFVAPMRLGFGIKNKTLEALAAGVPVIGSDRALEGLPDGIALRANGIDETVTAIRQLLDHPDQRQDLARKGRALIEAQFTWQAAGDRYSQAITHCVQSGSQSGSHPDSAPTPDRLALP